MKNLRIYFFILLLLAIISFRVSAHAPAPAHELRGVWLTNVASQVLFAKPSIAAAMDSLKSLGLNAIFPVMFYSGYTLYPSLVMLSTTGEMVHPQFKGRDVLAELIAEAHRVGIEVHPWFEYGFAASFGDGGGPILRANPNWAGRRLSTGGATDDEYTGGGFYWMSQAHPEVKEFLIALALEIVDNYDVDGIMMDRVRYGRVHFGRDPNNQILPSDFGYDDAHIQRYRAEHNGADPPTDPGNEAWRQWRAKILTEFNQAIHDSIKTHNPYALVSNSPVVYPYGYVYFMQDWPSGLKKGVVDFVAPQLYRFDLSSYLFELNRVLNEQLPPGYDRFYPGLLIRSGSYIAPADLAVAFVQENRKRNVQGGVFWFYEGIPPLASTLKQRVFQQPALPPFREGIWRPEATIVQENATTVQRIGNWTPITGAGQASYYSFDGAVLTARGNSGAALRYSAQINAAAYYDVYVYQTFGSQLGSSVPVRLLDGSGTEVIINQTNSISRGWIKVGTGKFEVGTQPVLEMTTTGVPSTQTVAADGVMLILNRQLSPEVIITSVAAERISSPQNFALLQNYPNPFTPATTIEFNLNRKQSIRLEVFDMQGRRVALLATGMYAAGNHRIPFDASHLTSGVYFYRLTAQDFVATRKLVLW